MNIAIKPTIEFDNVVSIDVRVCKVLSAERVPKKDRLILMSVDTGLGHNIQMVTNLGSQFEPEYFIDRKIPCVLNLPPAKFGGILSEGMIMAGVDDGTFYLMDLSEMPLGTIIL